MMVIQEKHRDMEIVYAIRYSSWLQRGALNEVRRSQLLALALDNLKDAGYTVEEIQAIERHAVRQLSGVRAAVAEELDEGCK